MEMPTTGGRWVRDPETGQLRPLEEAATTSAVADPTPEIEAGPVTISPPADTSVEPAPADRKKGK